MIFKVIGALLIVSTLILTQIPVLGTNASSVNNGFMMDGTKLVKYTGTANAVSVPDGVKTIGSEAFAENIDLSSISFPKGLDKIESGAFSGCTQLRRIVIPEGCTEIENGVFADCDKLEYVTLPASLNILGTSVFAGCDRLKSVLFAAPNPNFICDDGVIYNAPKTVLYQVLAGRTNAIYNMPASVEEIKKYAFWGCSNLTGVNVSSNVNEIGDFVFSNAAGLETISLPYSIRSIRRKAFEDCRNLTDITIPPSVVQIDSTAFDGCFQFNIIAEAGSAAERYREEYENSIAAQEEYEDELAQKNPHLKEDQSKNDSTKSDAVIPYASDVEHYVEWDVDSPGVLGRSKVVSGQAVVLMKSDTVDIQGGNTLSDDSVTDVFNIMDTQGAFAGEDTIAYKAFYCNDTLSFVQFPENVRKLDDFSFARSSLKEVSIPSGVRTIGKAAFYHCDQLNKVLIPASVTEIGEDAFTYTPWLMNWFSGSDVDDFLVVGDGILLAYKGTGNEVVIPETVRQIGPGVFKNHTEITKVTIPDSVTAIQENAFLNCSSLRTIAGMNQVSAIKDYAFYGCPIETVRIPAAVKSIGVSAFGGTNLTDSVIFLGTVLPALSYEDSATRLSAKRNASFDGIPVAVVNSALLKKDFKDTVLDENKPCFDGVIYHIGGTDVKTAVPVVSNHIQNDTRIPDTIKVYGNTYKVQSAKNMSFAEEKSAVSDNSLQAYMVVDHDELKKADVTVTQSGSTQDLSGYHFYVSDAGKEYDTLKAAIETHYGTVNENNSFPFDLSLYDEHDLIPIKQFGKNTLNITIPVSTALIGKELCVVTLDRNHNPEVIFATLTVKDNRQFVSFDVSHCSPYVLYAPDGELKDKIVQKRSNASGSSGLDDTPDTGDDSNIKSILLIGLFSLGVFFVLLGFFGKDSYRKKPRQ